MRYAFSLLALSATVVAQEPPILTAPAATTTQFNAAALGVNNVAQLTMVYDASASNWYVTATVYSPAFPTLYTGWSGRATSTTPGTYTLTANTDLSLVPPPTTDYFAFNVSSDLKVLVFDTGAASGPAVYARTSTAAPFAPFGTVPGVVGYVDSQLADTKTSWNGTTGLYEFFYIVGNNLVKADLTLTAPGTVTLGTPVTLTTAGVAQHSPSPLRQNTGLPSDWGTCRAFIHSRNNSSADSFFRSSMADSSTVTIPSLLVFDDANWKANPGHIGGSLYWAYAPATYGDPMLEQVVCTSSDTVPSAGGVVTLCAWAPPSATPQVGQIILGVQVPGIPLPGITIGNLGLNPAALVFLPLQVFDPALGELSYTFATGFLPRGTIATQALCLNLATNQIYLGNNGAISVL